MSHKSFIVIPPVEMNEVYWLKGLIKNKTCLGSLLFETNNEVVCYG